jgi:hypothetical protein
MNKDPYRFLKKKISKREDIPADPHFVVLHFTTRSETDSYDCNQSYTVPHIEHYCFTDAKDLQDFILECQLEKRSFVFYKVDKLGEAKLSITTDVSF